MSSADASSPSLVAPTDARSVDGNEVTFVWEPVEAADTYRLQVASTARFEELHVDAEVGAQTAVTVGNQFPTDGQTFFWRVLAETGAEEPKKSAVESFLATTAAEADAEPTAPAAGEEPVTDLARAAQREVAAEPFDFEDQFQKEKERGVAYEGVAASQIMGISASIIVVVLVAVAILFGWYTQVSQNEEIAAVGRQKYREIRQAERQATKQLQQYGVVDKAEGTYHIPIDRAMDIVAGADSQPHDSQLQQPAQ